MTSDNWQRAYNEHIINIWLINLKKKIVSTNMPPLWSAAWGGCLFASMDGTALVMISLRMKEYVRISDVWNETCMLIGWALSPDLAQPIRMQVSFVLQKFCRILSFLHLLWIPFMSVLQFCYVTIIFILDVITLPLLYSVVPMQQSSCELAKTYGTMAMLIEAKLSWIIKRLSSGMSKGSNLYLITVGHWMRKRTRKG